MPKFRFFLIFLVLFGISGIYLEFFKSSDPRDFNYLNMHCGLYDRNMKLIYFKPNYFNCDFSRQGMVLAADDIKESLALFDAQDNLLWDSKEIAHHWPKFSDDEKSLLVIGSKKKFLKNINKYIYDMCATKRNLENKILGSWCVSDHFDELKKHNITPLEDSLTLRKGRGVYPKIMEISHVNSLFEIPENATALKNSAFAKGNYILNLYTPTLSILILDKQLKNVLWTMKLNNIEFGIGTYELFVHAPQVLSNGNLLLYVNHLRPEFAHKGLIGYMLDLLNFKFDLVRVQPSFGELPFSMLAELEPLTKKIIWNYTATPRESFNSGHLGVVVELRNGKILFSENNEDAANSSEKGGRAVIIDRNGKIEWSQVNLLATNNTGYDWLTILKPLYDEGFVKSRALEQKY